MYYVVLVYLCRTRQQSKCSLSLHLLLYAVLCSTSNTRSWLEISPSFCARTVNFLKKNQTTPRPSEHPPVMGEKMSKRLGGIKRLQIQKPLHGI